MVAVCLSQFPCFCFLYWAFRELTLHGPTASSTYWGSDNVHTHTYIQFESLKLAGLDIWMWACSSEEHARIRTIDTSNYMMRILTCFSLLPQPCDTVF
jgi:hypothetical protein